MPAETAFFPRTPTPRHALDLLLEGNRRFVDNVQTNWSLRDQVGDTTEAPFPFATVLSCSDSRLPAEYVFNQVRGEIFSVRVAGAVMNEDVLGSLEYACQVGGSRLIVVLGNTRCDVVRTACSRGTMGDLAGVLARIQPAIDAVANALDRAITPEAFVERVAREHTRRQLRTILERSPILARLHAEGRIGLVAAMYSVESGEVTLFEEHFTDLAVAPTESLVVA